MADGWLRCERCDERFREARDLSLHRGRVHAGELDEAERASFEMAEREEADWLAGFRRHAMASLAAVAVLLAYTVVLVAGYIHRAHPAFMIMPLPGILGFAGLAYYMAHRHQGKRSA